jgi:hypothetical protein
MTMKRRVGFLLPSWLVLGLVSIGGPQLPEALAQNPRDVKAVYIEGVRNEQAAFLVRVSVDQPDHVYCDGDTMTVTVQSEKAGYLYLFYFMADGKVACLFPNIYQQDNHIAAHQDTVVPKPGADFRLRIGAPLGVEYLKAVVSLEPLPALNVQSLIKAPMTDMSPNGIRGAYVEQLQPHPAQWAEHDVQITTQSRQARGIRAPRRIGVFIGIGQFDDRRIRPLRAPANDARTLRDQLNVNGNFDEVFLLLDEEATLANIRELLCRRLPDISAPGDTVILFISTHGARCADDNGDEEDGYDEFLVVHDTNIENLDTIRQTVLLDDAFGRWLQLLDGRHIAVILDTCHSGGQAQMEKDIKPVDLTQYAPFSKYLPLPNVPETGDFDFLDKEFARVKDIGQPETALLAAAEAAQTAFERREGDFSVMTYCLLQLIRDSQGPLTLRQAYEHVLREVPAYVEQRFPGTTQTPVLVDQTAADVCLKPK